MRSMWLLPDTNPCDLPCPETHLSERWKHIWYLTQSISKSFLKDFFRHTAHPSEFYTTTILLKNVCKITSFHISWIALVITWLCSSNTGSNTWLSRLPLVCSLMTFAGSYHPAMCCFSLISTCSVSALPQSKINLHLTRQKTSWLQICLCPICPPQPAVNTPSPPVSFCCVALLMIAHSTQTYLWMGGWNKCINLMFSSSYIWSMFMLDFSINLI